MSAVLNPSPALAVSLAAAARAIGGVLSGASLNAGLEAIRPRTLRPAAQDLSFNALRGYGLIDLALERLLERPLMDQVIRALLLAALAELLNRPQSAHVVVHQAVDNMQAVEVRVVLYMTQVVLYHLKITQ